MSPREMLALAAMLSAFACCALSFSRAKYELAFWQFIAFIYALASLAHP